MIQISSQSGLAIGRIINGYRPKDLVLSLVYRTSNFAVGIAGLGPVEASAVENVDLSHVVTAHHKYRYHVKDVLDLVDLEGEHVMQPPIPSSSSPSLQG